MHKPQEKNVITQFILRWIQTSFKDSNVMVRILLFYSTMKKIMVIWLLWALKSMMFRSAYCVSTLERLSSLWKTQVQGLQVSDEIPGKANFGSCLFPRFLLSFSFRVLWIPSSMPMQQQDLILSLSIFQYFILSKTHTSIFLWVGCAVSCLPLSGVVLILLSLPL